jgi:2-polyprenyl-6-methoxyphenol hydroxylase-like FAD-dependent oxidoreductase
MSDVRSIAVVGGGIGGLTAATALLRAGFDVRVYEQSAELCEVGAGIQLGPNCTRILADLDLLPAVERVGVRPRMFEFRRWEDGRVLSATPLGAELERAYGAPYLHAHRGQLVEQLAAAVPADRLEFGRRCAGVRVLDERAEVEFADGSHVEADLVIGADGIHSAVRAAAFGAGAPSFTGHVAYRGLVPAERVAHLSLERNCTVWLGPGSHVVYYFVAAGRLLNVVCITEERSWTRECWTDEGDITQLRATFGGWHPMVTDIIDALDTPLKWALFDRDPLPRWSRGPVTLLGDACHAMLPYAAQGAAQAVEDAAVLATCLAALARHDIDGALARYEAMRRDRTSKIQAMSRSNGHRFHLRDGPEQQARDAAMANSFGISPEIDWLYRWEPPIVGPALDKVSQRQVS